MDKRQFRRYKRKAEKAEARVDAAVWKRMKELEKDRELAGKIENELKDLKTPEDYNAYIRNAAKLARDETGQVAGRSVGA